MSPRSTGLDEQLSAYVTTHSSPPDEVQRALIERTEALGSASKMQIAPEQGEFLSMLTSMIGASFAVEVGTFTGYSALSIARSLPADGTLICCDVSEQWTAIGREHWEMAGVSDRIDLRIGPGIETLRSLSTDAVVDLAFIDADKGGYESYYEELIARLAPNGAICVDNTLWSGAVADASNVEVDTIALRAFNEHVASDTRTRQVIVPIGDGLTLIRHA